VRALGVLVLLLIASAASAVTMDWTRIDDQEFSRPEIALHV
jgi:hypothetical protein